MDIWEKLYNEAIKVQNDREINKFIAGGQVAAAILTDKGNIYVGVCIDAPCALGICAERNAIFNMFTCGETKITKLVCVMSDKKVGSPCGACRELLIEFDKDNRDMEILTDYENRKTVKLSDLMPDWWGKNRMDF